MDSSHFKYLPAVKKFDIEATEKLIVFLAEITYQNHRGIIEIKNNSIWSCWETLAEIVVVKMLRSKQKVCEKLQDPARSLRRLV